MLLPYLTKISSTYLWLSVRSSHKFRSHRAKKTLAVLHKRYAAQGIDIRLLRSALYGDLATTHTGHRHTLDNAALEDDVKDNDGNGCEYRTGQNDWTERAGVG